MIGIFVPQYHYLIYYYYYYNTYMWCLMGAHCIHAYMWLQMRLSYYTPFYFPFVFNDSFMVWQ